MLAIVGTIPTHDFPLVAGEVSFKDDCIIIQGKRVPVNRGTPALLAAAIRTSQVLGKQEIFGYLVGDIGLGDGSRRLYGYLSENLGKANFETLVFHYLQPDVDWHNRVMFALEEMKFRPTLIADAGFMYAAKMSGQAMEYDLFTPDIGEMAFLADEEAPHPFYTRGFILHEDKMLPELITRSYEHENASRHLLVKGEKDYVATRHGIQAIIDSPSEAAMEAIGGTGDTLTGLVTALIQSGINIIEASKIAARANRLAGHYAGPTPATQVTEIIRHIPRALDEILEGRDESTWQSNAGRA